MQLAIRHGDVLFAEQGGLTALPPLHADHPFVAVEFLALELVAHRLELHPAALVLLVGEGKGVGDVLGRFAKGACAIPNLGGPLRRLGPANTAGDHENAQDDCTNKAMDHRCFLSLGYKGADLCPSYHPRRHAHQWRPPRRWIRIRVWRILS